MKTLEFNENVSILEEIKAELIYERYAVDSDPKTFEGLDIAIQIIEEKINEMEQSDELEEEQE